MFNKRVSFNVSIFLSQFDYCDIPEVRSIPTFFDILNEINRVELINKNERTSLSHAIKDIFLYVISEGSKRENSKVFNSLQLGFRGKGIKILASRQNLERVLIPLYQKAHEIYAKYYISDIPDIPHPNAIVRLALMNFIRNGASLGIFELKGELTES